MSARTDFAELRTVQLAQQMGANLPAFRVIKGRVRTPLTASGGGIEIGIAHLPARGLDSFTSSEEHLQAALLEPRTARPLPILQRIVGAVWRWF